ncbi:glycogen/starch/alpha-glucan phosphorylase, partial [Escherichia coli]|uniref:glycogen/starch/alpha-glucan phosphorylase n=1 Tax=Escherichia coli TaxID=562 RepID=UPI00200FFA1A
MRLLIDEHKFSWDEAFEVTCQVFSYTNHTLMSEALETWPVDMLGKILPRHLQIIFEINDYFLKTLQEQYPNDTDLLSRTSIIDESNGRRVRMAWLAAQEQAQPAVEHEEAPYPLVDDLERFYDHLEQTLLATGFIRPNHPGQVMNKLRRLFTRARP